MCIGLVLHFGVLFACMAAAFIIVLRLISGKKTHSYKITTLQKISYDKETYTNTCTHTHPPTQCTMQGVFLPASARLSMRARVCVFVCLSVRAKTAIKLLIAFRRFLYFDAIPHTSVYVDGGMSTRYPLCERCRLATQQSLWRRVHISQSGEQTPECWIDGSAQVCVPLTYSLTCFWYIFININIIKH